VTAGLPTDSDAPALYLFVSSLLSLLIATFPILEIVCQNMLEPQYLLNNDTAKANFCIRNCLGQAFLAVYDLPWQNFLGGKTYTPGSLCNPLRVQE
jgi:hypothetical protein